MEFHGCLGTGAANRSESTGASAYGTLKNDATRPSELNDPCIAPAEVTTTADVSAAAGLRAAAISKAVNNASMSTFAPNPTLV